MIPWVATGASFLPEIAWQDDQLWVRFSNGNAYRFDGVPKRSYSQLLNAANKKQHFLKHIKGRFSTYERLKQP